MAAKSRMFIRSFSLSSFSYSIGVDIHPIALKSRTFAYYPPMGEEWNEYIKAENILVLPALRLVAPHTGGVRSVCAGSRV